MTTIKPFRAWFYVATCVSVLLWPFGVRAQDLTINFTGAFQNDTCTITTPSIVVNMGGVSVNDITAVGVGAAIPAFSSGTIQLTCEAGANPEVALFDANNSNNVGGSNVTLTPGTGVASGVGIQLFQSDGTPILLQLGIVLGRNTPAGPLSFPFTAHYYRAATTVTAGAADALVIFQCSYP